MRHPKLHLTVPWTSIELEAQQQIDRVLALPELEQLAIMPDVHPGYDLCIGGVALLDGAISPSFVGYDIGCGMCHVNLKSTARELGLSRPKDREKFFDRLAKAVPAGLGKRHTLPPVSYPEFQSACEDTELDKKINQFVSEQLATLGSGNHFLEIGENAEKHVGITIHSGSRRAGYEIAEWYMGKGRMLPVKSALGQAYWLDMNWAIAFALENRKLMVQAALLVMGYSEQDVEILVKSDMFINEHHNHAERHGDNGILHRKGATPAGKGQMGIIPANQRDGVWITRGLGNEEFLCSASHGAGRKMTRGAARKKGTSADMQKLMKGIICYTDKELLDEAPWAYKKIDDVLAAQEGKLVEIIDHFAPIIVLKGKG